MAASMQFCGAGQRPDRAPATEHRSGGEMRLITRGHDNRQVLPERRWRHAVGRASLTVTAVFLLVTGAPFGAAAGGAKHPFDAMAVPRPAEPLAAAGPGLASVDGGGGGARG